MLVAWRSDNPLDPQKIGLDLIFECFVKCQMINVHDLSKQEKYETLQEVEYLEFLTRIAMAHFSTPVDQQSEKDSQ